MTYLGHIADRILGRPLLLWDQKAITILNFLSERILVEKIDAVDDESLGVLFGNPQAKRAQQDDEPADDVMLYGNVNGVAVIPVLGSLVNRGAFIGPMSGLTSYDGLQAQFAAAAADPHVHSILMDMDSAGGEANGIFAMTETIRHARKKKKVYAMVNDMAASAAYAMAAQADEITITPTSITGSIGVVMMHIDKSEEMAKAGKRVTLIYAGDSKIDGNQFGPLSSDALFTLQRDVNMMYDKLIETVVAGRPQLSADKIRNLKSKHFMGEDAIKLGLADNVGSFAETLARLSASPAQRRVSMNDRANNVAAESAATAIIDTDAVRREGATSAASRIKQILECEEAKGREAQAQHIALNTSMSFDEAKGLLATFPVAQPAAPKTPPISERANAAFDADASTPKPVDHKASWRASLARVGAPL